MKTETKIEKTTGGRGRWTGGKALAGLALAAGLFALPGCFIESSPPSGPPVCTVAPAVSATWDIAKEASGAQLSCAQAAGVTVRLTLNSLTFDFPCADYAGLTTELAPGSYTASFTLYGGASGQDVLSQTQSMNVTVGSCGVTNLGQVPFDVL